MVYKLTFSLEPGRPRLEAQVLPAVLAYLQDILRIYPYTHSHTFPTQVCGLDVLQLSQDEIGHE